MMMRRALWFFAFGALFPGASGAQVTVIDEGTFTLLVGGERVGREDFSIRAARGAGGAAFVAQGSMLAGERRELVALNIDSLGAPLRFQLERREGADVVETYQGTIDRGVWTGRSARAGGESAREIRLPPGSLAAEPAVIHHLWLLLRFNRGGAVRLFSPRTLIQQSVILESVGEDSVAIGRRQLRARHWTVRPAAGGAVLWELWADPRGRLLRVVDVGRGIEALRDEPPGG
jgi:hypothetical protein